MNSFLTTAFIDPDAVRANIRALLEITNPGARMMAVVKANAYGHGCVQVSKTALSSGADWLGVARVEEGRCLREAGISAPILVFGYITDSNLLDLIEYDLIATAFSLPFAKSISEIAKRSGKTIRVHAKVDTGMGRLGLLPDANRPPEDTGRCLEALNSDILSISKLPGLDLEGIYTHFATADGKDLHYASAQFELFLDLVERIEKSGLKIPILHAANSGATINMPETHLDMVRPGIAVYGLYPSMESDRSRIALTPAMTLKTRLIHVKKVPAGFPVSYGNTYTTKIPTAVATVPIGYADGYRRAFSNRGQMLVRGLRAPVIGRVCMDFTLLDVGHIPGVVPGDEVVVIGEQENELISADDLAATLDTINYEIVTSISDRIPREYCRGQC
jgi:alanine racemase